MASAEQYKQQLEDLIERASSDGYALWLEAQAYVDYDHGDAYVQLDDINIIFYGSKVGDYATADTSLYYVEVA